MPLSVVGVQGGVTITLNCDTDHGRLPGSIEEFTGRDMIETDKKAKAAGWKFERDGKILGPCCTRHGA